MQTSSAPQYSKNIKHDWFNSNDEKPVQWTMTLLLLGVVSASRILPAEVSMEELHDLWMEKHGKTYGDAGEKARRLETFAANMKYIESFNAGSQKYRLGANRFADLTNEEFRATYTGRYKQPGSPRAPSTSFKYRDFAAPESLDWRTKGAVTPVKDQQECGACWAFSAVASIESANQIKKGKLVSLSEQELVDCDVNGEDQGCSGGLMDNAFSFIIKNGGITTEANYPYKGADGTCDAGKESSSAVRISGFEDVPANSEASLLKAVANQPVSVAIDGGDYNFQLYSSGVFTGPCATDLDHAVTVVGYGIDDGVKFWLVKNSWGTSWGEKGYIRMERDVDDKQGLCGLAMQPSYPTV
ncbi:hypothetical protein HPP92_013584 [Vanilla planifolia]|uniref:Uncharacterized protein n=1 Tax=Vanilla planifolia TaxID=51239 RepID=A0A835QSJ1_VANPL|nr:hypothetical protein HPP92_013584 [Vanilla planifolia]